MELTLEKLHSLQDKIEGKVYRREDPGYDENRRTWNLAVELKPKLIVVPKSEDDIVSAVRYAQENGFKVAVNATGHGTTKGASDSLLISTKMLKKIVIDRERQTAWVEAGAEWGDILKLSYPMGLAPLMGSSTGISAVGYTLGGGIGWLARKYGLSADNVNYFRMVTADGRKIRASKDENSDLYFALCGGGGSYGIVSSMEINLVPVKEVYGGSLIYPSELAKEVFLRYRGWVKSLPEELTSSLNLVNFPDLPYIPEMLRGKSFVSIKGAYCGNVEEGESHIRFWTDWKEPLLNGWKRMPFSEVDRISEDPIGPMPTYLYNVTMDELSDEVVDILIKEGLSREKQVPIMLTEIIHYGGASMRYDDRHNAYGLRKEGFIVKFVGLLLNPKIEVGILWHISNLNEELKKYKNRMVYINFAEGEVKWNLTREAYTDETYSKLLEVKEKYDPLDMFCFALNIPAKER